MSELNQMLKEMGDEISGILTASVVGMDGLSLANFRKAKSFDEELASAQFALVMKLTQKTMSQLGDREMEDNLVTTRNIYVLTRFLGDGSYFLIVAVTKSYASLGNIRLITRQYSEKLWDLIPRRKE